MTARIVVAGCGYWGQNLVRKFAELGALVGLVDARADVAAKLSDAYGAPVMTWQEALASDAVDGIVVAAPAEQHMQLAVEALKAGKHVFVEKPIALSMADGEQMRDEADKAGRILMVGHLLQYHPAFIALLHLIREGELGTVRYAYSNRLSLGKFRTEENALWSLAPHDVSMVLAVFNEEPLTIVSRGDAFVTPGIEDMCRLDMTFSGGRSAHLFASWLHPFKEQRLVVVGENAMVVFEDSIAGPDKLRLYRHGIDTSSPVPVPLKEEAEHVPFSADEPLLNECAHFLECIATGASPRTDAAEALRVLKVLTATSATTQAKADLGVIA
jgi:predicted dehydrogenase